MWICVDNLETGSLQNIEHHQSADFQFINHDVTRHLEIERVCRVPVYHLAALASPIDYLRMPLHSLSKVGSHGTHNAASASTKIKRARFLLFSESTRGLSGPARPSSGAGDVLGETSKPDRATWRIRRKPAAVCRGADDEH